MCSRRRASRSAPDLDCATQTSPRVRCESFWRRLFYHATRAVHFGSQNSSAASIIAGSSCGGCPTSRIRPHVRSPEDPRARDPLPDQICGVQPGRGGGGVAQEAHAERDVSSCGHDLDEYGRRRRRGREAMSYVGPPLSLQPQGPRVPRRGPSRARCRSCAADASPASSTSRDDDIITRRPRAAEPACASRPPGRSNGVLARSASTGGSRLDVVSLLLRCACCVAYLDHVAGPAAECVLWWLARCSRRSNASMRCRLCAACR